jgi:hypothetical protein
LPHRLQLGWPVRIVPGEARLAGSLALQLPEQPRVLIDGRFDLSPWVSPGLLRRCGAVQIGRRQDLPSGKPVDAALPELVWRVIPPAPSSPA